MNKLLKTILPIATLPVAIAPVMSLTSCGKINGPKDKNLRLDDDGSPYIGSINDFFANTKSVGEVQSWTVNMVGNHTDFVIADICKIVKPIMDKKTRKIRFSVEFSYNERPSKPFDFDLEFVNVEGKVIQKITKFVYISLPIKK